jgi:hypothetical protein
MLVDPLVLTPTQTELVDAGLYMRSPPVPGAKENLLKLKAMGYK